MAKTTKFYGTGRRKAALPEYISLLVLVRSQSTRRIWTSISVLIH